MECSDRANDCPRAILFFSSRRRHTICSLDWSSDVCSSDLDDPELAEELHHLGLELRTSVDPAQLADGGSAVWLGATMSGAKVSAVFDDSPAQAAGLSPGDEVIALDGFRVTSEAELRSLTAALRPGDRIELAVFRRARLLRLPLQLGVPPATRYEIVGQIGRE